MAHSQVARPKAHQILRSFREHRRLIDIVHTMALEIERIEEDNRQLRAALSLYREFVRRTAPTRGRARQITLVEIG